MLSACESTAMFFSVCTLGPNFYIPHIAQGQGWSTRLYIVNGCDESVTFRINLVGHDGAPKSFVVDGSDMRHEAITNGTDPMESPRVPTGFLPRNRQRADSGIRSPD